MVSSHYPVSPSAITVIDQQQLRTITAGTTDDIALGFPALSVTIDNITSQWMYLPSLGRFIPPQTHGWSENLLGAVQRGQVQWIAPPGRQQPTVDKTQRAHVTWSSKPIQAPSTGLNLSSPVLTTRDRAPGDGSALTVLAGNTGNINIGFDSNVQALLIALSSPGPLASPPSTVTLRVSGLVAGSIIVYWPAQVARAYQIVPISGALENPITVGTANARVTLVNGDVSTWQVDIIDVYVNAYQSVSPSFGTVWTISPSTGAVWDVSDRAARVLGTVSPVAASTWDVSDRAARAVGAVSPAAASTWDVSDRRLRLAGLTRRGSVGSSFESSSVFNVNVALPAGAATTNIINGAANTRIYVWGGRLTFDTAAATFFNLTDGVTILDNYNVGQFPGPYTLDFDGNFTTGIGNPLALAGFAGGAASVARGYLIVTQS